MVLGVSHVDESVYEQAQALTERLTQAAIEQTMQGHLETPLEINGQRFCPECDERLSFARMNANPRAVRCVECQNDHDRRSK